MIRDARGQNKSLREAAGRPKDTSHRLKSASNYSAKISSDTSRGKGFESASVPEGNKQRPPGLPRGSSAGLIKEKSAYLQPSGSGYDRKSIQKARYSKPTARYSETSVSRSVPLLNNKNNSIMNNYTSETQKDSSSDRLNKIIKTNMMFR
jgi:hypothetical protein